MGNEVAHQLVTPSQVSVPRLRDAVWSGPLALRERAALGIAVACNERVPLKRLTDIWAKAVVSRVVSTLCGRRLRVRGVEHLERLAPSGGILLATNHRTFFDLFTVAYAFSRRPDLCQRMYFPVRSGFWYEHPLGVLVNGLGTGMSMFPPIFRPQQKRDITRRGLDWLAERLSEPGVVVGMHPEGTRSREPDPYTLLPAEQSFGRVALLSRATIVPAFVTGLSNSIRSEVARRRERTALVDVAFGAPVSWGDFQGCDPLRLRNQLALGQHVLHAIQELAEQVRG